MKMVHSSEREYTFIGKERGFQMTLEGGGGGGGHFATTVLTY